MLCCRENGIFLQHHYYKAEVDGSLQQSVEIERRIKQETKAEKHVQKILLLGVGESGKSTIFKQLLFRAGFDEVELKSYAPVIHATIYQTVKVRKTGEYVVLYDVSKELAENEKDSSMYVVSNENKNIGEKLSEITGRLDYPCLDKELAQDIRALWGDPAIQETCSRKCELHVPDCTYYFMDQLERLSEENYVPTKDDILHARVRTTGAVEIQFRFYSLERFSPENKIECH